MYFAAPPPPVTDDKLSDEELFELPTLEDVARATGTLRPNPLGTSVELIACFVSMLSIVLVYALYMFINDII